MSTLVARAKKRVRKSVIGPFAKWDNAAVALLWAAAVATTIIWMGKH